jgi:prephenate dehydratase
MERVLVNSNAQAAIDCAEGRTDGCITTAKAAAAHKLQIITNHGAVPMVFTIHVPTAVAASA